MVFFGYYPLVALKSSEHWFGPSRPNTGQKKFTYLSIQVVLGSGPSCHIAPSTMSLVSTIHWIVIYQAPVVQTLDNTIHLAPVVQTLESAIHWIKIYPVDNAIGLPNTYQLDSDLSGGLRYPTFEQPGPDKALSGDKWDRDLSGGLHSPMFEQPGPGG